MLLGYLFCGYWVVRAIINLLSWDADTNGIEVGLYGNEENPGTWAPDIDSFELKKLDK